MRLISTQEILRVHEESGKLIYEAIMNGDYKTNNREQNKLMKIFKQLENDYQLASECIPLLLCSQNVIVRIKGATYGLALKISINESENILNDISNDKSIGIVGMIAEMPLKRWKENADLILY